MVSDLKDRTKEKEKINLIEGELEKLSIQIITILKKYRDKGLIQEKEYENHIKKKEDFLNYLDGKRRK